MRTVEFKFKSLDEMGAFVHGSMHGSNTPHEAADVFGWDADAYERGYEAGRMALHSGLNTHFAFNRKRLVVLVVVKE